MRRLVLLFVGAVSCLAVSVAPAGGQEQGQRRMQRQDTPAEVNVVSQDPNQPREVNAVDFMIKRNEQLRQSARERIRERARERRWRPVDGAAGRDRAIDMNTPPVRRRPETVDRPMPTEKPISGDAQHQQLNAIEQQLSYEQDKHMDRLARLNRIRELAQQQGDTEALARVDKLIGQEQHLYDAKSQRMTRRQEKIAEFSRKSSDRAKKRIGSDANMDGNQPMEK